MLKKWKLHLAVLSVVSLMAVQANAGFSLKNVLKGKNSESSNTNSAPATSSTKATSKASSGGKNTYIVENKDDIAYDLRYECNGKGDNWKKVVTSIKPKGTFKVTGENCDVIMKYKHQENFKRGYLHAGGKGGTTYILYGDKVLPDQYEYHTTGDIGDSSRVHFAAKRFGWWLHGKYKFNDKNLAFKTVINGVNKHLRKKPKVANEYKAIWIINKPEYGQYCMEASISSGFEYKTKRRYFQGGRGTLRTKASGKCK